MIPLGYDGGGGLLVVDLDPAEMGTPGQILALSGFETSATLLAPSLADFVTELVGELREGGTWEIIDGHGMYRK